jgi:hypothetical protein
VLLDNGRADLAQDLLTRFSSTEMLHALNLAESMVASMDARSRVLFGVRTSRGWRGPEILW